MSILTKGTVVLAVLSLFALPLFAGAQTPPPSGGPESLEDVTNLFETILGFITGIFWILAIIFILYAAFLYLTAAGDEDKVKKASSTLLYAVIAVAIAIFATILPTFISNFLGGQ